MFVLFSSCTGQRINLTIYDFTTFNAVGNTDYASAGDYCAKYGAIEEPAGKY